MIQTLFTVAIVFSINWLTITVQQGKKNYNKQVQTGWGKGVS